MQCDNRSCRPAQRGSPPGFVGSKIAPPFRHAVCHGVRLGEDGRKVSKRLRNYPDPMERDGEGRGAPAGARCAPSWCSTTHGWASGCATRSRPSPSKRGDFRELSDGRFEAPDTAHQADRVGGARGRRCGDQGLARARVTPSRRGRVGVSAQSRRRKRPSSAARSAAFTEMLAWPTQPSTSAQRRRVGGRGSPSLFARCDPGSPW